MVIKMIAGACGFAEKVNGVERFRLKTPLDPPFDAPRELAESLVSKRAAVPVETAEPDTVGKAVPDAAEPEDADDQEPKLEPEAPIKPAKAKK